MFLSLVDYIILVGGISKVMVLLMLFPCKYCCDGDGNGIVALPCLDDCGMR